MVAPYTPVDIAILASPETTASVTFPLSGWHSRRAGEACLARPHFESGRLGGNRLLSEGLPPTMIRRHHVLGAERRKPLDHFPDAPVAALESRIAGAGRF